MKTVLVKLIDEVAARLEMVGSDKSVLFNDGQLLGAAKLYWDKTSEFFGVGTDSPEEKLDVDGAIALKDGVSTPSTHAGKAVLYVDTADGDLKVKFGDGTVKTIATDT